MAWQARASLRRNNQVAIEIDQPETDLCRAAYRFGSDKCPRILHTYTPKYDAIFRESRRNILSILEIGIGRPDLMIPIVGDRYQVGASLRMWRSYFPRATVFGADICRDSLIFERRIHSFFLDQSCPKSLENLASTGQKFDIIVDDGSHEIADMLLTYEILSPLARKFYIIEDIRSEFLGHIPKELSVYQGKDDWDSFGVLAKG
jgi:8-demethyl-8-alpha-L-rhamnosyltetracenomycin-C 2'-O-methyltransferase